MKRSISNLFLENLKNGALHVIVDHVRVDPYLDLELRGNCVMVYYRGGKILTVYENQNLEGLAEEYYKKESETAKIVPSFECIHEYFAHAKHIVDIHESSRYSKLGEKEIQQRVVYENNLSVNACNTDYFIADIEWADNDNLGGRADIVAFRWNHMGHRKRVVQLTLIEVKQGENAIKTFENDEQTSAGLRKHYTDFLSFKSNPDYVSDCAKDMLLVLKQKKELGLIKGIEKLFEKTVVIEDKSGNKIRKNVDIEPKIEIEPDFLFLLANYHHYSTNLQEECNSLPDDSKFVNASFCGYGLYKDFVKTKKELGL